MVGDLFHVGHINLVRSVRERGYDVVVGVHSDVEVEGYKRTPVMTLDERVAHRLPFLTRLVVLRVPY